MSLRKNLNAYVKWMFDFEEREKSILQDIGREVISTNGVSTQTLLRLIASYHELQAERERLAENAIEAPKAELEALEASK